MLFSLVLSERKQEKKKRLSAFTVEALLPKGQANSHAVISPALNRWCLCSPCHFCCHNFVWSLIDFFSLFFSLWPNFSFSVQKPTVIYLKANSLCWQPQSCNELSVCKSQHWYSLAVHRIAIACIYTWICMCTCVPTCTCIIKALFLPLYALFHT